LGEDEFVDNLMRYIEGQKEIKEIPRHQRYIKRPGLHEILSWRATKTKEMRNRKIREAIKENGYSQKELAEYLGMHYSTISRLVRNYTAK